MKTSTTIIAVSMGILLTMTLVATTSTKPVYAPASSAAVGVIGGAALGCGFPASADFVINGGCIPVVGLAFAFTPISLPLPALATACGGGPCDTLILNVASTPPAFGGTGLGCTTAALTAVEKAALVAFMTGGGKLVIYDSECAPGVGVDYTWLPASLSFTTFNPGALGALGCGDIIEDNTLSSSVSGSATEINMGTNPIGALCGVTTDPNATPAGLCPTTDACGDANVMVALGSDLCKDIDVTTGAIGNPTGTAHAYSRAGGAAGSGIMIYNGFDQNFVGGPPFPAPGLAGAANLVKLLLQELTQPWSPSGLPCGKPFFTVGGEILSTDMTSLLVAGAFANALWILPVLAGIAGAAIAVSRVRSTKPNQ